MGVPPSGALAWRYCRPHQVATEPVAGGGRQLQNASASGEVLEDGRVQEAGPQTTERDVERIVSRLGPAPRAVLDAPCGAGRHSLELAARGYDVLGIDFNPTVLAAARSAARARKLEAEFQLQDLRELNAEEQYDAVICLWTSIGYFSEEDNERVLLNLARAVKPGGHLFLDLVVLESLCAKFSPRDWVGQRREPPARLRGAHLGSRTLQSQRDVDLHPRSA